MNKKFDIGVNVRGQIETKGANSFGIFVEAPGTDIDVNIASSGAVIVNSHHTYSQTPHYAVVLAGFDSSANKSAIVTNRGLISGSVYVDGCTAQFNNRGVLKNAKIVELGTNKPDPCNSEETAELVNSGTIRIGDKEDSDVRTMTITGDFIQKSGGVLQFDAKWENGDRDDVEYDKLEINGEATIEGQIEFNVMTFPRFTRADYDAGRPYEIEQFLRADILNITDQNSLALDTILLDFGIKDGEPLNGQMTRDATLQLTGLERLNWNQRGVFWGLNEARNQNLAGGADAVVVDALRQQDLSMLRLDLDRAGNEIAANAMHATSIMAAVDPADGITCRMSERAGRTFRGCVFVAPILQEIAIDSTFEQRRFVLEQRGVKAGLALYPESLVDEYRLALSFQEATIDMPHAARATGDDTRIAVRAARTMGPVGVHVSAHHGSTDYTTTRMLPTASATRTVEGKPRHKSTGFGAGLAIPFDVLGMAVRPRLDLMRTRVKSDGYTEEGEDDLALTVAESTMSVSRVAAGADIVFPAFTQGGIEGAMTLSALMIHNREGRAHVMSSFSQPGTDFSSATVYPKRETGIRLGLAFASKDGRLSGHVGVGHSRLKGGGSGKALHLAAKYDF